MPLRPKVIFAVCLQFVLMTSCGPARDNHAGNESGNRLANSSSPYLKEHADNPVDWYEWGPEALQKAEKENKVIIILIAYSNIFLYRK